MKALYRNFFWRHIVSNKMANIDMQIIGTKQSDLSGFSIHTQEIGSDDWSFFFNMKIDTEIKEEMTNMH